MERKWIRVQFRQLETEISLEREMTVRELERELGRWELERDLERRIKEKSKKWERRRVREKEN